jgi:hypothetical protein
MDATPDGLMLDQQAAPQPAIESETACPAPPARPALTPCFGVACACRGRCARYSAVDDSQADPATLVTCANGHSFPLFVDSLPPARSVRR